MDRLDDVLRVDLRDDLARVDLMEEVEEVEDGGGWWRRWRMVEVEAVAAAALYLEQRVHALQARRLQPGFWSTFSNMRRRRSIHNFSPRKAATLPVATPPQKRSPT